MLLESLRLATSRTSSAPPASFACLLSTLRFNFSRLSCGGMTSVSATSRLSSKDSRESSSAVYACRINAFFLSLCTADCKPSIFFWFENLVSWRAKSVFLKRELNLNSCSGLASLDGLDTVTVSVSASTGALSKFLISVWSNNVSAKQTLFCR